MPKKKATPEELKAAVELQLSERRFILESINTVATLIQVPLVTAGIWYYMSRTTPALGVLNKAILTAELTPLIGDIKFPEGVLLGAAMESSEDMLNILDKAGLLDDPVEVIKDKATEAAQDTGDFIVDQVVLPFIPDDTCAAWTAKAHAALDKIGAPLGGLSWSNVEAGVELVFALKKMKKQGCPQPSRVSDKIWGTV